MITKTIYVSEFDGKEFNDPGECVRYENMKALENIKDNFRMLDISGTEIKNPTADFDEVYLVYTKDKETEEILSSLMNDVWILPFDMDDDSPYPRAYAWYDERWEILNSLEALVKRIKAFAPPWYAETVGE